MSDETEFSMFETTGDDDAPVIARPALCVGMPYKDPLDLNRAEETYRRWGICPVMFVDPLNDEDPDGPEVLGNALEFAVLMGLDPEEPVTVEEAMAFRERYTGASGEWLYWRLMEAAGRT
jgi:hypothetical protein